MRRRTRLGCQKKPVARTDYSPRQNGSLPPEPLKSQFPTLFILTATIISIMCRNGNGADQRTRWDVPALTAQLESLIRSGLTDPDALSKAFFPCNDGFAYTAPVG